MILLVDKTHFAALGIILAVNLDETELERYISQAQEFDIKPQLGDIFYYDLLDNASDANYAQLIAGEIDYTYLTYSHKLQFGLAAAICYYAYARYLPYANKKSTEMGFMLKKNEWSDQADTKAIQLMINDAKSAAIGYMSDVLLYLNRYETIDNTRYPLWRNGAGIDCKVQDKRTGLKLSKVGNI
jgi:hypothetical protein